MKDHNKIKNLCIIPEEKVEMNVKARNGMKKLCMSLKKKAEMNVKACNGMKIFRHGIPNCEKIRRRKNEALEKMKVRMTSHGNSSGNLRNCGKEALKFLHRNQYAENPHKHKSIVCVICDRFIIGTEIIHYLLKESIIEHNHTSSVKSYETYYGKLTDEVKH
jgi:hypothetical protein